MFAELARRFILTDVEGVELLPFDAPIVNRYILDHPELSAPLGARRARNAATALSRYLLRVDTHPDCEIIHNTFYLPHGLAPTRKARRVVTVHDMIPERLSHTRRRLDWLTLKRRYVETADHVICVSEYTKQDLLETYGPLRAPISVVHHGVDERFHPNLAKLDFLPERYLLFVGNRDQYKDAEVLFRAFSEIAKDFPDLHLLCVGGTGLTHDEVTWLTEHGIRDRVSQRFLTDLDMASAYAHAELFVFPSRYEGFGIPALEAMACGTPALLADATSLPEVGGGAARYFRAGDASDLVTQVTEILDSPAEQERLRDAGFKRAREFTWAASAAATASAYQACLE